MPELPEVETTRLGLLPFVKNKKIQEVVVNNPNMRWPIDDDLHIKLEDQTIIDIKRRAKYLIFELKQAAFIVHLGMSGHIKVVDSSCEWLKHDHVGFRIGKHWLRLNDPRRFGAVLYTPNPWQDYSKLQHLGPEPLEPDFHAKALYQKLQKRQIAIKTAIMDNKVVVGVGNIYACEALFKSKISPLTQANALSLEDCKRLVSCIKSILKLAIQSGGTTLKDFQHGEGKLGFFQQKLKVYGKFQEPCQQCHEPIAKITQSQRSTFYCENCQK